MGRRSDVFYLYAARAARGFGDGFAAIILPAYLIELGFDPLQIGLVATAALLGSAAMTLAIGFVAPRYDLRTLLLACALLMVVTGIAIPNLQHFVFIALIAFVGTMNPTAGDIGVMYRWSMRRWRKAPWMRIAPGLRALQPDRRTVDRGGCAGGRNPGPVVCFRHRQARCVARRCSTAMPRSGSLAPAFIRAWLTAGPRKRRYPPHQRSAHRAGLSTSSPPCSVWILCRWLCRSIPAGALAVRTVRSVARRRQRFFLLVERAHRLLLSGGSASADVSASSTRWSSRIFHRAFA